MENLRAVSVQVVGAHYLLPFILEKGNAAGNKRRETEQPVSRRLVCAFLT